MPVAVLLLSLLLAVPTAPVSGVVRDASGAAIPDATIVVRARGGEAQTKSHNDGTFTVGAPGEGPLTITVRAAGFADKSETVPGAEAASNLEFVLSPATVLEAVTVTATKTEQRLGDVPASVTVLTAQDIKASPAVVADDVLRQVPEFSLFRRTSSLSSHPTSQGVSLRGIGPSGVSRTLVLLDGVPFNDPFGGWVYWSRVPLESADRVEIVDGSSSNLYGNYAMGGVINIVTTRPVRRLFDLRAQYGNLNSPKGDFVASDSWGRVGAVVDGSLFSTDGYPIVAASERGRVDNNANDRFRNLNGRVDYRGGDRFNAYVRGGYFRENRDNGKASTIDGTEEKNDTTWKFVSGGADVVPPDQSNVQVRGFGDFETFHSNFLAVPAANPPRSLGRMTLNQAVPTTGVGGSIQWARGLGASQFLTAGADIRGVDGDSEEDAMDPVTGLRVITHRVSGGSQRSSGLFVQDLISPSARLQITLSARVDHWRNYDAHNLETTVATGLPTPNNRLLPERSDTVASPRIASIYHLTDRVSAWGDLGWGFRAPTLNELYRQFRVGNVLTLANDQLGPERLVGGEAGLNVAPTTSVTWRTTWFDNEITNPVSNVTQSIVSTQITRQRQNLGKTRVWGIQSDVDYRITRSLRVAGGYLFDNATVLEFAADPMLVDNRLPQVPRHRGTAQVMYTNPRLVTVAVQAQFAGEQFDDDQNRFPLPAYGLVDLRVTRAVSGSVDAFVGVQNLFDHTVIVGTNPTTIGAPRLVNAGVRIRFLGR